MVDNSRIEAILSKFSWIDKIAAFVWIGLTILILIALQLIIIEEGRLGMGSILIIILIIIIWLYPLYTLGFSSLIAGLIGNIGIFIFTLVIILIIRVDSSIGALLISPVLIWLAAATFYVILQIMAEK